MHILERDVEIASGEAYMRRLIGIVSFLLAIGMLLMLITHNRLVGLVIIALLLFVGYNCLCGD